MARSQRVVADDVETPDDEPQERSLREEIELARDTVIDGQVAARYPGEASSEGEAPAGPVRDDSGRFTRRSPDPEVSARSGDAAVAAGQNAESQGDTAAGQAAESGAPAVAQPGTELAPQGWTPAAKAEWAKLPPLIKAEVARREADAHRLATRHDEERAVGRSITEIAQANRDVIERTGLPPARLFQDFMGIIKVLNGPDPRAKAALLRDVAMRNGLDANALFGNGQSIPQPANPAGQAPQSRDPLLLQIAGKLQAQEQATAREAQERQQREEQEVMSQIVAFRSQPDAPYFDSVRDHMIGLLNSGVATTLKDAYDQACWARPDIRAQLLSQQQQQQAQAAAKAERARQARAKAGSVRGGTGSVAAASPQDRSIRDELRAGFAEARSRV